MNAPPKPLLIWDGACGFCRRSVERWRGIVGGRADDEPFQTAAARFPEIPLERFRDAVALIEPDGRASFGAEAVLRSLRGVPGIGWLQPAYGRLPGFARVAEAVYGWIARRRGSMP